MDTKIRPIYMLSTRNPLQSSVYIQTESERMEKYIPCEWEPKEARVVILISDKIDLKIKKIRRDKEGHYIMMKGSIQEEDVNNCKYLFTQHRSTSIHKTNTNRHKRRN